jgi:hypothetical protein
VTPAENGAGPSPAVNDSWPIRQSLHLNRLVPRILTEKVGLEGEAPADRSGVTVDRRQIRSSSGTTPWQSRTRITCAALVKSVRTESR